MRSALLRWRGGGSPGLKTDAIKLYISTLYPRSALGQSRICSDAPLFCRHLTRRQEPSDEEPGGPPPLLKRRRHRCGPSLAAGPRRAVRVRGRCGGPAGAFQQAVNSVYKYRACGIGDGYDSMCILPTRSDAIRYHSGVAIRGDLKRSGSRPWLRRGARASCWLGAWERPASVCAALPRR